MKIKLFEKHSEIPELDTYLSLTDINYEPTQSEYDKIASIERNAEKLGLLDKLINAASIRNWGRDNRITHTDKLKWREKWIKDTKNRITKGGKLNKNSAVWLKNQIKQNIGESLSNPKVKTGEKLADMVLGWYDFDADYIDDGSQRRRVINTNNNVVEWFGEHPTEIKQKAYSIMKTKVHSSDKAKMEREFGKKVNENIKEAVSADQIRQSMSGFVGTKFAKKASDEDIMKMVGLKDKIAKIHNSEILPIQKQIDALYKQYKIKSTKGIEESINEDARIVLVDPNSNKFTKTYIYSGPNKDADATVQKLNSKLSPSQKDKGLYWKIASYESVNEVDYKTAVSQFNAELEKHPDVAKAAKHYGKTPADIVKALQMRLSTKGDKNKNTKEVSVDFKDTDSGIKISHKKKFTEGVSKSTPLNEVTVTRIPNFNLESDAYIVMLYLLKSNSGFKKAATNAGIDLFSGANTKTVFAGLHNNLKKVITPQIIKSVVQTLNQKRKVLFIDDADIQKGVHNDRFAGLLALGVIDSFVNDPIDTKLLKDLGNAKLNDLANQFSINRGKMKLGAMLGNKGF